MTKALRQALEAASRLERWEVAFARSQDALERLADEALEDLRARRTEPLDPDAL